MLKVTLGPGDAASIRISGRSSLSPSRELQAKPKHNSLLSFITGFYVHANIHLHKCKAIKKYSQYLRFAKEECIKS